MAAEHTHNWVDAEAGCGDCGEHPAVRCDSEDCPDGYDGEPLDLVYHDDPRE